MEGVSYSSVTFLYSFLGGWSKIYKNILLGYKMKKKNTDSNHAGFSALLCYVIAEDCL